MEENMSDEDRENPTDSPDNAKRFKTDTESMEKLEESSTSSNNVEQVSASTSTDSGFPRSRSTRHRFYRTRSSTDEGTDEIVRLVLFFSFVINEQTNIFSDIQSKVKMI